MAEVEEIQSALDAIDPAACDYTEWCNVGMALASEGLSCDMWDAWSSRDVKRYHAQGAESCAAKWRTFTPDGGITINTLFSMAYDNGWSSPKPTGQTLSWDSKFYVVSKPGSNTDVKVAPIVTPVMTSADVGEDVVPMDAPTSWVDEVVEYLTAVFEPSEYVGFVTSDVAQDEDGKWRPIGAGDYRFTREQVVAKLLKPRPKPLSNIGATACMGDSNAQAGAYVRINPLDGKGASDKNVTAYRHALIESDSLSAGKQLALIRAMKLPVVAVVYSGGKSVHGIVRVDAANENEYRERVNALYEFCEASGFVCDKQNRNPSRLSRLPGMQRGDKWQRLIPITWECFASWDEWQDWVAEEAAGLPPIENLSEVKQLPPLAPELIYGVLRDGQKGMLTGPSKAGKSFALIQLAVAIANGWQWLGHACARGRVLYINLEIQKASFLTRVSDVYAQMAKANQHEGVQLCDLDNIDVWNLRGHAAPLDKLVPLVIRRAKDKGYRLVIVDPIYKVLTGDENSASDMSHFTNQFDIICNELGCSVVYAHHHAKGKPGERMAADRASGSGVFARDPDAMIDMSELDVPDNLRDELIYHIEGSDGELHERHASAYRLEYTLREFESPLPRDVLFKWPLHEITDMFHEAPIAGSQKAASMRGNAKKEKQAQEIWNQKNTMIQAALDSLAAHGQRLTTNNVWQYIEEHYSGGVKETNWTRESLYDALKPSRSSTTGKYCNYERIKGDDGAYIVRPKNFIDGEGINPGGDNGSLPPESY